MADRVGNEAEGNPGDVGPELPEPGHAKLRIPTLVVGGIKSHVFGTIASNLRTEGFEVTWHWDYEHGMKGGKKPPARCRAIVVLTDLIPHRDSMADNVKDSGIPYIYTERKWATMQQHLVGLKKQIPEFAAGLETPVPERSVVRRRRVWHQQPQNKKPGVSEEMEIAEQLFDAQIIPADGEEAPPPELEIPQMPVAAPAPSTSTGNDDLPYDELKQMLAAALGSKDVTDLVDIMAEKHFVTKVTVTIVPGQKPKIAIRREIEDTI